MWIVDGTIRNWRAFLCLLLITSTCFPSVHADAGDELCVGIAAKGCLPGSHICVIPPTGPSSDPTKDCLPKDNKDFAPICAAAATAGKFHCTVGGCCCLPEEKACNTKEALEAFCQDGATAAEVKSSKLCNPGGGGGGENSGSSPKSSSSTVASTVGDASGSTSLVPALSLILASLLVLALPSCV